MARKATKSKTKKSNRKSTKGNTKPKSKAKKSKKAEPGGIIKAAFKARYKGISKDKVSCGDTLSQELAGFCKPDGKKVDVSAMGKVAKANGIDIGKWDHLNVGQVRMCLGNVLRTMVRKGKTVKIGTKKIKVNAG